MATTNAPDLAHFKSHGLDQLLVYCSARECSHAGTVTFAELDRRGIPDTATVVDLSNHRGPHGRTQFAFEESQFGADTR